MIRVAHISSAPFTGGAARAGFRLHYRLLEEQDVTSQWLDAKDAPPAPSIVRLPPEPSSVPLIVRMRRKLWNTPFEKLPHRTATPFSDPNGWGTPEMLPGVAIPNVWNLHWVSWFLNWEKLLPWMARKAPIVWTLHDLNPLRGIWHYEPIESERNEPWRSVDDDARERKRRAMEAIPKDRVTFVGPSQWMTEEVRQSEITKGFPVENIPYGIDTQTFAPKNRQTLRDLCGVASDAFVIGFLADAIDDPRKGIPQLCQALEFLAKQFRLHVVTVGRGEASFPTKCAHTHLGPLRADRLLTCFYSGCDLFVCPSLQDNLPNTVLESLACGTPVAGFEVGGLPDMIRADVSGRTASPVGSAAALAEAISLLLGDPGKLSELRTTSRELATQEYDAAVQAKRYLSLYQSVSDRF